MFSTLITTMFEQSYKILLLSSQREWIKEHGAILTNYMTYCFEACATHGILNRDILNKTSDVV